MSETNEKALQMLQELEKLIELLIPKGVGSYKENFEIIAAALVNKETNKWEPFM